MDSITQAVLGAAIGEEILGKKIGGKGALIGAIVATIPDLDVIFYLFYSKLDMLSIHRGLSHSILCSVLGGLLVAVVLSRMKLLHKIKYRTLLWFSWLCLFTHILLDAFTAYGTQLLLPFSNDRVGFDSINVVDPVYTIPLIIGLIFSVWFYRLRGNRASFNRIGLLISSLYLVFTLFNKLGVEKHLSEKLSEYEIAYNSLLSIPVGMANVEWYGVAKGNDSLYILKHSLIKNEYSSIESFAINEDYLDEIDNEVAEKMRWFAKGFYTLEKKDGKTRIYNLQVDMRGISTEGNIKAPTAGYFLVSTVDGETEFSSGSIKD